MHLILILTLSIATLGTSIGASVLRQHEFEADVNRKSLVDQLYGDLLISREGFETASLHSKIDPSDEDDEVFKARCGFYNENPVQLPSDELGTDLVIFAGIVSFAHLPIARCFAPGSEDFDIAIVGAPYDTSTSFRPGARFGPNGIRQGSRRLGKGLSPVRGFPGSKLRQLDPYNAGYRLVDCGDVPMSPFDNRIALNQLYRGQRTIHKNKSLKDPSQPPRIITLGGDHTVTLMNLRSAYEQWGRLAVIHFDSHIDSWDPKVLGGNITKSTALNHGTFLHYAHEKGYLAPNSSIHVGIRAPLLDPNDEKHDFDCGFEKIVSRDIDIVGIKGIVERIRQHVAGWPVYLTLDIDSIDMAVAPGTGTPEPGGYSAREILTILDGLEGINIVGADVVEVAPAYDTNGDITSTIAASVVDSVLGLMTVN
ncbi:hypothetical protein ZYGR_0AF00400 [Zygosaccharomyces rouxii]|uniref:Agmatinase 1 n=1 Tax=Zygosaccharomyces rouxii TaxID=4956 RepID=A0A1Q3A764_ZYGRO|nr:hypothetical protein ZYGR_0AF00400 [Zygosaccharomyces rouxii]